MPRLRVSTHAYDLLQRCYRRAFRFRAVVLRFLGCFFFTRSGSFLPPVSRFHSSKVLFEISPLTSSSANLRRCAWLLNGITVLRDTARAASPARAPDGCAD